MLDIPKMNNGKSSTHSRNGKKRQQKPQQKRSGQSISIMSEELADELHKPVRKHFEKRRVISKHVHDILTSKIMIKKVRPWQLFQSKLNKSLTSLYFLLFYN